MRKQIDKTIAYETYIDYDLTPGFIVGIVDGENSMIFSFGRRDLVSEDTISIYDVFELGSVTKVFTASLLAELEIIQQFSLDDHIDSMLPERFRNAQMSQITLKDLLIHQSGLPRYPVFKGGIKSPLESLAAYSLDDLLNLYRDFRPEENDQLQYSNLGYALIEPVLYGITGLPYQELLQKHLTPKIGGESITTDRSPVLAPGYNFAVEAAEPVDFGVFTASGGLRGNMYDLLKFVHYSLTDAPEILLLYHGMGLGEHLGMGLGWHIIHQGKHSPIYMHTGRTLGHTAFIGLVPNTSTGVVILCNSANSVDDLGVEILRLINNNWKRKH
jgi:CubicO group peptidase (beta-lactamase class C family)